MLQRRPVTGVLGSLGDARALGEAALQGPTAVAIALRTGRPELARNVDREEYLATLPGPVAGMLRALGAKVLLAVPLLVRGRAIGAMSFAQTTGAAEAFDEETVAFLRSLADHAALALANAQLLARALESERALRVSRDRLGRTLAATGLFAEATADQGSLLDAVVRQVSELLDAHAGLMLVSKDGATLDIVAQHASDSALVAEKIRLAGTSFPLDATAVPAVRVVTENAPLLLADLKEDGADGTLHARLRPLVDELGVNDFAGVPLRAHGRVVGALCVQQSSAAPARRLGPSDLELLQLLAD